MARHGLILSQNGAIPSRIIFVRVLDPQTPITNSNFDFLGVSGVRDFIPIYLLIVIPGPGSMDESTFGGMVAKTS